MKIFSSAYYSTHSQMSVWVCSKLANSVSKVSWVPEQVLREPTETKLSQVSKLSVGSLCSIGIRSRIQDMVGKPMQLVSNWPVKIITFVLYFFRWANEIHDYALPFPTTAVWRSQRRLSEFLTNSNWQQYYGQYREGFYSGLLMNNILDTKS